MRYHQAYMYISMHGPRMQGLHCCVFLRSLHVISDISSQKYLAECYLHITGGEANFISILNFIHPCHYANAVTEFSESIRNNITEDFSLNNLTRTQGLLRICQEIEMIIFLRSITRSVCRNGLECLSYRSGPVPIRFGPHKEEIYAMMFSLGSNAIFAAGRFRRVKH